MTPRRPQMTPRRAKRSPRRAKVSSGRLPGAFWAGFPTHFQATRGDRDAPYSNRRRGRVAPEQGYRLALGLACFRSLPRDRARKLRKRRTRNSRLCLVVLCLGSSRRCFRRIFLSNARRPRRSLLKPPARARSARARLQAGAGARMFSQPSPGSSQKAPKKTHEKLTAVPRGALPWFFSPLFVLVSSSSPSLAMLAALAFHALPVPR